MFTFCFAVKVRSHNRQKRRTTQTNVNDKGKHVKQCFCHWEERACMNTNIVTHRRSENSTRGPRTWLFPRCELSSLSCSRPAPWSAASEQPGWPDWGMLVLILPAGPPEWRGTVARGPVWIRGGWSRTRPPRWKRTPQARGATVSQLILTGTEVYIRRWLKCAQADRQTCWWN